MIFRGGGGGAWGQRASLELFYILVCKRNWTRLITVLLVSFPVQRERGGGGRIEQNPNKKFSKIRRKLMGFLSCCPPFPAEPSQLAFWSVLLPSCPWWKKKDWQVYPVTVGKGWRLDTYLESISCPYRERVMLSLMSCKLTNWCLLFL